MAETRCKYYKQKRQVSYDGGQTWQDVIPYQYQKGELYEYESADCGAVIVYRWVNMDASTDYYCEGTTKYYKQKKQVSYDGGQTWQDVSPAEYQKGGVAEQRSTDCGYVPPTPQYRWIKSDDTICVEPQYRWVNMDASVDYYCEGTTKYYKQKKQISLDDGQTWQDITPAEYQKGGVAEAQSTDCGYVPPTPTGKKFVANYSDGKTLEVECNGDGLLSGYATKPSGYDYSKMTSAVIGNCVTVIARYSGSGPNEPFSDCTSLTAVTIPDSVTDIGDGVFYGCSSLPNITIPTGVTKIYKDTFTNCTSLADVTLPSGLTFIGQWAFLGCTSLTAVTIPDSVTSISTGAFSTCTGLTSVKIPDSLTSISQATFQHCYSLTSIVLPNNLTSIGSQAFQSCSGLTSISIPDNVTSIGDTAFLGCTSLTSATIGSGVTAIGSQAFDYCSSLASVTINATTPPFLPSPSGAFDGSNCLILVPCESVSAYKSATNWSKYASRIQGIPPCGETSKKLVANYNDGKTLEVECNGDGTLTSGETQPSGYKKSRMTNAVIGNCVTIIGDSAFEYCTNLTSVTIPNSVTTIGYDAFYGCGLTSVTIPNSVTSIGEQTFTFCDSLTSVTIPNSVITIGDSAFNQCTSLTSIDIPNSVTSIGNHAFANCSGLTSLNIGNSVTTIGSGAFWACSGFTFQSVVIPNSVTSIDSYAFYSCRYLTSVTIGNSVTSIGDGAFEYCTNLTSVTVNAITPPTLGGYYTFDDTNNCPIYVPAESVDAYKAASGWSEYASRIQAIP